MSHDSKPKIIVTDLPPHLARYERLKFQATLVTDSGEPETAQGVTVDDALNNLLTALAFLSWSANRHDYDIHIK